MSDGFIGLVCGLQSEAKAVRAVCRDDKKFRIDVSGANAARAEEIADAFCGDGARVILSIGVSGALDPKFKTGDLLIGDRVVTASGETFNCDEALFVELYTAAHRVHGRDATIFGANEIIASADDKARLFLEYKAGIVDMESHGVARAAARAGVAFAAIRTVADPAQRAIPAAALSAVAPDGSTRVIKTLLECAKAPAQLPALLRLGSDSEKALKTLQTKLGPVLGAISAVN